MKKILIASLLTNLVLITFICYQMELLDFRSEHQKAVDGRQTHGFYYDHSTKYSDRKTIFETLPRDSNQIVFLGDSHIEWFEWSECFKDKKIANRGISGDITEGILNRLSSITASRPDKIFIKIGNNDLFFGFTLPEIISNYKKIISVIKTESPKTKMYIISCLPNHNFEAVLNTEIVNLNTELKKLASDFQFPYIDLHSMLIDKEGILDKKFTNDKIHLNGEGYLVWKKAVEKYVYE